MSDYGKYIKEREGFEIIEDPRGFVTYKIYGAECYIRDIWINPDYRHERISFSLGDQVSEIATKAGCKTLIGSVLPTAAGSTESMRGLLQYGFKLNVIGSDGLIYLRKEI